MVVLRVRVGLSLTLALLLLQELLVADGGESSSLVDDGSLIDSLMDGNGLVNGCGLDGFSLDDGLDCKTSVPGREIDTSFDLLVSWMWW